MKNKEAPKQVQEIVNSPEFRALTPHEQILYLQRLGINFMEISGWGIPTTRQQEVIDIGATNSIAGPSIDGKKAEQK